MLASMLHSIAVGNMLPSDVGVVCVDINPLAVTKLLDRGTTQAIGLISDVGAFLPLLVAELGGLNLLRGRLSKSLALRHPSSQKGSLEASLGEVRGSEKLEC